jgi:hypothetical protein
MCCSWGVMCLRRHWFAWEFASSTLSIYQHSSNEIILCVRRSIRPRQRWLDRWFYCVCAVVIAFAVVYPLVLPLSLASGLRVIKRPRQKPIEMTRIRVPVLVLMALTILVMVRMFMYPCQIYGHGESITGISVYRDDGFCGWDVVIPCSSRVSRS